MSRFDNELIKQADNAFQQHGLSGQTTTPRQQPYDQTSNLNLDGPFGLSSQAPAPINETADWVAGMPMTHQVEVRDLDAVDAGEIIGGPGSSPVYAEGGPMYASAINPIEESLYNVYKASREIRDAIDSQVDFDFSNLFTASSEASTVLRFASSDDQVTQIVGTVASIVSDIESDLENTGDYRQASADLVQLEELLQDINKHAAKKDDDEDEEDEEEDEFCKHCHGKGCEKCKKSKSKSKSKKKASQPVDNETCLSCKRKLKPNSGIWGGNTNDGPKWCRKCFMDSTDYDDETIPYSYGQLADEDDNKTATKYYATNGNQETLQVVDVRDLDDQAGVWDRDRVMAPDHQTNVLVPEEVNGEDAGYVPFYNDGSETGIIPQNGPHHQEVWPMDGTNPAYAPYAGSGTVAAVQASRERIFEAMQVVERLEKLGMVQNDDRAKHIAKFEQMSDSKLAGFKASLDMLEESGARQPRSQKVASGSNRLPEMGRLTTASKVARQDVQSDDWLMTL